MNNSTQAAQPQAQKEWSKMTKKERRHERLEKHYNSLQKLYDLCGGGKLTGHKLSSKLLAIEQRANRDATAYCNGDINMARWELNSYQYEAEVQKLFNNNLTGLLINGDARGYTLKIDSAKMASIYAETNLHKDWGSYGILAPEINGDY